MTHLDLFSGIGGFALAARWAGIKTVQFVELDPFCQKVLNKNFPGVPIHDDIKTFTYTDKHRLQESGAEQQASGDRQFYEVARNATGNSGENPLTRGGNRNTEQRLTPYAEGGESGEQTKPEGREDIGRGNSESRPFLLTGGFPCQPFSAAGKRQGTADDRYLWPEMLRVIQEANPRWVIAENVPGIISLRSVVEPCGDADMESEALDGEEDCGEAGVLVSILTDLENSGYSVIVFVIPACAVGAPHRRDRVWIVGRSIDTDTIEPGAGNNGGQASDKGRGTGEDRRESIRQTNREACTGWADATDCHAPDTEKPGLEGRNATGTGLTGGWDTEHAIGGIGTDQAGPWQEPWIEAATRLCTVDDGLSGGLVRPRGWRVNALKAAGNAIVPQIAYEIMKAIVDTGETF